jgi:hypothetical protein
MKPIDLRKLATNFANEKSKEERYRQRNDAKFRAVHQRCSNYDEFRQIVEAAHLRPLDRNETLTLERQAIAWNQPAGKDSPEIILPSESTITHPIKFSMPKNVTEFLQQWRRISNEMKLDYLHRLKNNWENFFQMDIPMDFLHDLSLLYQSDSSYNDAELIIQILSHLIKSKRFELMKSFLTQHDQVELDRLFSRLCSFVDLRFSVFLLKTIYL